MFSIFIIVTLLQVQSYEETLTIISIDSSNTLNIMNFTDKIDLLPKPFLNFNTFPIPIWQLLQHTQEISINLAWGTGEVLKSKIEYYKSVTNRQLSIAQPGLSGFIQGRKIENFKETLSGALSISFSKRIIPVFHNSKSYFADEQFLCKENLEKILDWLPCRDSGLSSTFTQLLTSKYLNIQIKASKASHTYTYTLIISSLKKEKLSGYLRSCNTKVEIFEDQILQDSLNLNKINLSPVKSPKIDGLSQHRWVIDEEHGFSSEFFHEFSNESGKTLQIVWFETFPVSIIPLLSTCNFKAREIWRNGSGWVLKFEENFEPGKFLLKIRLDKKMLGFEEYPCDPQRGWDILPAPVFVEEGEEMSNGLLVMIPEPDFSMPFNVICITGSAIAFFFTSFQNLQTWKDSVHWSNPNYENSILKAKKRFGLMKNIILVISLLVMFYLDQKGIIKMFG